MGPQLQGERSISEYPIPMISFSSPFLGPLKLTYKLRNNLTLMIKTAAGIQLIVTLVKFHLWKFWDSHCFSSLYLFMLLSFHELPAQLRPPAFLPLSHLINSGKNFTTKVQIGMLIMQQFAASRNTVI